MDDCFIMEETKDRGKVARKATLVGMAVNLLLLILKFFIGLIGNSAALISDAVHTFTDLIGDVIVLVGFKFTSKPADHKHNYGHGKIDTIVSVLIGMLLLYISFQLIRNSVVVIYNFFSMTYQ